MRELSAYGRTLPEAYHEALSKLDKYGTSDYIADWDCMCKECAMTMVVQKPLEEPMISKLFIGGPRELEQYRQEMLDGILDFEISRGNWTYTYHDRMVNYPVFDEYLEASTLDQVRFVIDELKRNPSSRRAVIVIRDVTIDAGNDDPACLQNIQYMVRDGKLDCFVLFRSNDAAKATFMNAFALIQLQKRIADELGVEVGTYTHRANNFHCYQKDWPMLAGYVQRINNDNIDDITYDYEDDWKDIMEEYQEDIAEEVEELKRR